MSPPEHDTIEARLRTQIEAYHAAGLAYAAVKLGLPETMGVGTWTAERLAARLNVSAPHLSRMLHGLATLGLVAAQPDGTFVLTAAGASLAPGASTLREKLLIVVEQYWQPWANVAASVKAGAPAFDRVFGKPVADWRRAHAEHGDAFDSYLARETYAQSGAILDALDLGGVRTVADLGGGWGGLLAAILEANPGLHGMLFDQPHTIDAAKTYLATLGLADRVSFVAGDFPTEIPVEADLYLLKSVLQQQDDAHAQTILETVRRAMPDRAKLIVIERLMPEEPADDPAAVMADLHMMVISGGRARTRAEIEALLEHAGLEVSNVATTGSGLALITATA
jgi:cyclopropane fatty-acyl-phospholipid synthase-like methyltransferase